MLGFLKESLRFFDVLAFPLEQVVLHPYALEDLSVKCRYGHTKKATSVCSSAVCMVDTYISLGFYLSRCVKLCPVLRLKISYRVQSKELSLHIASL